MLPIIVPRGRRRNECPSSTLSSPTFPGPKEIHIKDDPRRPGLELHYYPQFLDETFIQLVIQHLATLTYVPRIGFNMKQDATRNYYRWYATDHDPPFIYGFSRAHYNALTPHSWTPELITIRDKVEDKLGKERGHYNAVLINFYPKCTSNLNKHHDNDPWLEDEPTVASISIGATREFELTYDRIKTVNPKPGNRDHGDRISILLESGSLA